MFEIPVVLFIFKRKNTVLEIIKRLEVVKPKKIYLVSDEGRNSEEKKIVKNVREKIEEAIKWDCQIIKNYAQENIGVYKNIGCGAKWVFEREEKAIFLEDDNLPEITFFRFCKEMLNKYQNNNKVLWVCGTNYLEEFNDKDNESSYFFTRHMLPCGWASWSNKFLETYDGELKGIENKKKIESMKESYVIKNLYFQEKNAILKTKYMLKNDEKNASWDRQMLFSVRSNKAYGIAPYKNQIKNIGVDEHSTHGGNSFEKIMTKRFCGMNSLALEFPLKHPIKIETNKEFEKETAKIILYPLKMRLKILLAMLIKPILRINKYASFSALKQKKGL